LTDFNKNFCAINAYNRIDKSGKGFINSLDLVTFFRENSKAFPEADTYMLVNQYD
jgi:Ca2+-binding EF-hand superfamily protein